MARVIVIGRPMLPSVLSILSSATVEGGKISVMDTPPNLPLIRDTVKALSRPEVAPMSPCPFLDDLCSNCPTDVQEQCRDEGVSV